MATDILPVTKTGRPDANRLALRAARAVLEAAAPFQVTVEGTPVHVEVDRLAAPPWPPNGLEGLDEAIDGPLPRRVHLKCSWQGGSAEIIVSVSWWQTKGRYRHLICLRTGVAPTNQEIVSTTVALPLKDARDGETVPIPASFSPFKRKDEDADEVLRLQKYPLKAAVDRSRLPLVSPYRAEAFSIELPSGAVRPSPEEGFRRIVRLSLLKLSFFVRGEQAGIVGKPLFDIKAAWTTDDDAIAAISSLDSLHALEPPPAIGGEVKPAPADDTRRQGVWPLPGGVRQYKETLDALLAEIKARKLTEEDLFALLQERYEVTGETARAGYRNVLLNLGLVRAYGGFFELTPDGEAYLLEPTSMSLFRCLNRSFTGLLEVLVIVGALGRAGTAEMSLLLNALLGTEWRTQNQVSFRRNWLLSLGATERLDDGDVLTDLGLQILRDHEPEVLRIRARLDEIIAEIGPLKVERQGGEGEDEGEDEPEPALLVGAVVATKPPAEADTAPSAWDADRLDLKADRATEQASGLELPALLLEQACAALSAGKHLLLVGPPGTGKTELAMALTAAAQNDGYCAGAFVATASADWTTFDTIGGYALQRDTSLAFRPGAFLRAIERWQWLVIDELNRADVDRAFGDLMTVLAGRGTDTALVRDDGRLVSIGPELARTHRVPRTFRVLATMNTWDKTSLFRLSYAVQRRFAVIHVGVPEDDAYARLLESHATQRGLDLPLEDGAIAPLTRLFSSAGLLAHRAIGPAVALDMVRYMRRRRASGDGLAEAIAMYLLPQLEGLEQEPAQKVLELLLESVAGWAAPGAISALRRRYQELFPHLSFGHA